MWGTICNLPHRHDSKPVKPILVRNKVVFAHHDLRGFRKTHALQRRHGRGASKLPQGAAGGSPLILLDQHSQSMMVRVGLS